MGTKRNEVNVKIERTKSMEELLDISSTLEKLTDAFGEPCGHSIHVVFDEEEHNSLNVANNEIEPVLESIWTELQPAKALPENVLPATLHYQGDDGLVVMIAMQSEKISPKKAILKAIKKTGYQYRYNSGGIYECLKINQYNHKFVIFFSLKTGSDYLAFEMHVSGYNFWIGVPLADGVDVMKQSIVEESVQKIIDIALKVEERLTEPLYNFYGKTPDWYN